MLKPGAVVVDVGINVVDGQARRATSTSRPRAASPPRSRPSRAASGRSPTRSCSPTSSQAARSQATGPVPLGAALPRRRHAGGPPDVLPVRPRDRPLGHARARSPTSPTSWASATTRSSCTAGPRPRSRSRASSARSASRPRGKYVLVTAISPDARSARARAPRRSASPRASTRIGKKATVALRQPSPRPRVRDQGRRRGRRLLPGHPDGGLQPPPDRRRPRDRRRAQPRRGLHRQPHPPRQRSWASTPTTSSGRGSSTSATAPCATSSWASAAATTATRARASS